MGKIQIFESLELERIAGGEFSLGARSQKGRKSQTWVAVLSDSGAEQ